MNDVAPTQPAPTFAPSPTGDGPVRFSAGAKGQWRIDRVMAVCGAGLEPADRLAVGSSPPDTAWGFSGIAGHARYATAAEVRTLAVASAPLGRPVATRAALIPIAKNARWWTLAQDERRAIMAERSDHFGIGLDYLPAVARRLFHSRDLGEPFDFLTWFEFAPDDEPLFDQMLERLRATDEWRYVHREVDVRLSREPS